MDNELVKKVIKRSGNYGIYKSFLDTFNIVNLDNGNICPVMNFLSLESACDWLSENDF